jgi:hypothetical protein
MKAMFVLHENDPPEYQGYLDAIVNRVSEYGGQHWKRKALGERKGIRNTIEHTEYHFIVDHISHLVKDKN